MIVTEKKCRLREILFFIASLLLPTIIIVYSVIEDLHILFSAILPLLVFVALVSAAFYYTYKYIMYKKCISDGEKHKVHIKRIGNMHVYVTLDDEDTERKISKMDCDDSFAIGSSIDVVAYKNCLTIK